MRWIRWLAVGSPGTKAFAAIASLALYLMFVFTQTVRHRDFFLPVERGKGPVDADGDGHADPPGNRAALGSVALLLVALLCVVGLAKVADWTCWSSALRGAARARDWRRTRR